MAAKKRSWDLLVIAFILVCLIAGWLMKEAIITRTVTFTDTITGISFEYPARWLPRPDENSILSVFDPQARSFYNDRISFTLTAWLAVEDMGDLVENLQSRREGEYPLYHVTSMSTCEINSVETSRLDYVYAAIPPGMSDPNIVKAVDIIIPDGDLVYILTLSADEDEFDENLSEFDSIISSISSS